MSAKRFRGSTGALVQVVHRQPLSRSSALAVVTIGSRVLVLGTTEQQVQLLTELDPEELVLSPEEVPGLDAVDRLGPLDGSGTEDPELPTDATSRRRPVSALWSPEAVKGLEGRKTAQRMRALGAARASDGALAGSLLSAHTWRQAFTAAIGGNDRDAS
jgi:flagellar protein FliO/FliZ